MSTSTMREALDVGLRHSKRIAPAFGLSMEVQGATARFVVREAIPTAPFQAFATETLLVAYAVQARALLGKPLPVRRVQLAYPRPSYAERYREINDVPHTFGAASTFVELDAAFLAERLAYGDPARPKLAEQHFAEHSRPARERDGLVHEVRRRILAAPGTVPEVATMARELRTSERTLRRGLQELGTSYQALVDEARRERAIEWTRSTRMPFEQIAAQLGFGDVRSFRRAFKRWTARTPSELRDERSR